MGGVRNVELRWMEADYDLRVDFLLQTRTDSGGRAIVRPIMFEVIGESEFVREPTLSLDRDEAINFLRSVMDAAWKMGVRPTGYDNDLGATKAHLTDMRRIVFHKLGIQQ